MMPERWQQIRELLHGAMQVPVAERSEFLDSKCCSDPTLRKEVESFLSDEAEVSVGFLEPPIHTGVPYDIGNQLGPYKIAAFIGAGGMGEVYKAQDTRLERSVAIKILSSFFPSGQQRRKQFLREARAISLLQHPNICTFYELGHHEGMDFLVMEFVEGLPIDKYCDEHRLTMAERLRLFCRVCSAVQYAHQHLIIHRDIKPSNILVSASGEPKLLDFGLAKIVRPPDDEAQPQTTFTLQRALTPAYASPEQLTETTVTTATDLYSLGVVLHELLTGRSPYRLNSYAPEELIRAICQEGPAKPSSVVQRFEDGGVEAKTSSKIAACRKTTPEKLTRALRRDLDNIMLMALRKEPPRRYSSVEQFANDIERHLDNLPVLARKDTLCYRTSMFVRRHRFGVPAAAALGLTLLIAFVVTVRANRVARSQTEFARTERARAERRFKDVRQLANWMILDLPGAIHPLPGSITAEKMLYDNGLKYLDSIASEAEGDLSLQRELAVGYKVLGDAQGFPYGDNVGDFNAALASYRKSLRMREQLINSDRSNIADQIDLAKVYRTIGALLNKTGDAHAAQENTHKALEIIRPLAKSHEENTNVLREYGNVLLTLASVDAEGPSTVYLSDPTVGLKYNLDAIQLFQKLSAKQSDVPLWKRQIAYIEGVISMDYLLSAKPDEAIHCAREALAIVNRLDQGPDVSTRAPLIGQKAIAHSQLGDAMLFAGRLKEAVSEYRAEIVLFKIFYNPKDRGSRSNLAAGYVNLGHAESLSGEFRAGLDSIQHGLALLQSTIRKDAPADKDALVQLGSDFIFEGEALEGLGDEPRALRSYKQAVATFNSPTFTNRHALRLMNANALAKAAGSQARLGHYEKADDSYRLALATADVRPDWPSIRVQADYTLIPIYTGLGDVALRTAERPSWGRTRACEWYKKARDLWLKLPVRNSVSPVGFKVPEFETVSYKLANCK